jgi:acyl-ACP thioesterase
VPGYDCDFRGELKPAALFCYLTDAAAVHAETLGTGFASMLERNLHWVLSRLRVRVYKPALVGSPLTLRTWPKTIQQKLFYIRDFEVLDINGERVASASSAWLVIDAVARRMLPPQALDINLPSLPERLGLPEPLDRLSQTVTASETLRRTAGYSSVDLLNHVNNSRYVEWICDSFTLEHHQSNRLAELQVNYDQEVRPGDEVALHSSPIEGVTGSWALEGRNLSTGKRAFEANVVWAEANTNS